MSRLGGRELVHRGPCPVGRLGVLFLFVGLLAGCDSRPGQVGLAPDSATLVVHYIERPVGTERFTLAATDSGYALRSHLSYEERGSAGQVEASLVLGRDLTPVEFAAEGHTYRFVQVDVRVAANGSEAEMENLGRTSTVDVGGPFFPARGYAPLSARVPLIAYWERQGRPRSISLVPGRPSDSIVVQFKGIDTLTIGERQVSLRRYSVDGVVWGREAVWLDDAGRFAAVLTRMHILPLEGVRSDLVEALPLLQAIAVRDRMADLATMAVAVRPLAQGDFALVGVRVVDGTGSPPLEDATVVVRGDRIAAVGRRAEVVLPPGLERIDATGTTVVPGLWDMHGHVSQIEWGTAYLAAGVTTVRDMGGEEPFLNAFRDAVEGGQAVGPRLLLAGLVDGDDSLSFGTVTASTVAEGRAVVDRYHEAGFRQMKLYSRLRPDVVSAITARAHELGMTVTGHIPSMMTLQEAVAAGMDEVAHMPVRGTLPEARDAIAALAQAGTVVDPTLAWGELLGRSRETSIASFEPGIDVVAGPLASNYHSAASARAPDVVANGLRETLALVKAMHDAGVLIVAGTDGAVPGFSLVRELELYVAAGLTPLQALQSGTVIPARVLGLAGDVGTVQVGRRADLLVLEGDPLEDISNLRRGRWVVTGGRIFGTAELRR